MKNTPERICSSNAELHEYHLGRVGKLISSLKRIIEEAAKENDTLRVNRHGRKYSGTYFFYVNKDMFFRFIDDFVKNFFENLVDYLSDKSDPELPQYVCPLFGLIINSGNFQGVEMKNIDYHHAMEIVFMRGTNRTASKHRPDVGGYCVRLMSSYKVIQKNYPNLYKNISEVAHCTYK